MTWLNCLGNKKPIEMIYSDPPSLSNVRLHEVRLHQDGPSLTLRFDLNDYPNNPPKKWVVNQCNRAQLSLVLIDISKLEIKGWDVDNIGTFDLIKLEDHFRLTFEGKQILLRCNVRLIEVEDLTGYFDTELIAE